MQAAIIHFPSRRIVMALDVDRDAEPTHPGPYAVAPAYRCPLDRLIAGADPVSWAQLVHGLPCIVEVMEAPAFRSRFPGFNGPLPLVAWSGPDEFEVILDAQNLNDAMDLDGFRWLLDATLATRAPLPAEPDLARAA